MKIKTGLVCEVLSGVWPALGVPENANCDYVFFHRGGEKFLGFRCALPPLHEI